jgi:hypothetical protein
MPWPETYILIYNRLIRASHTSTPRESRHTYSHRCHPDKAGNASRSSEARHTCPHTNLLIEVSLIRALLVPGHLHPHIHPLIGASHTSTSLESGHAYPHTDPSIKAGNASRSSEVRHTLYLKEKRMALRATGISERVDITPRDGNMKFHCASILPDDPSICQLYRR